VKCVQQESVEYHLCYLCPKSSELNLDLENGRVVLKSATLIKNTCAAFRDKRTKKWSVKILFCFSGVLCRLKIIPSRKLVALETFVKYDYLWDDLLLPRSFFFF